MKKFFATMLLVFGSLLFMSTSYAAVKTFEATGEYVMGDGLEETLGTAKQRASKDAMRNACEQVSVYLESYLRTINVELTHDEIATIAVNIIEVVEEKYEFKPLPDRMILIKSTIKVQIDTDEIDACLEETIIKRFQERNDELKKKIAEMKRLLEAKKSS